jgi:hypothetical protein
VEKQDTGSIHHSPLWANAPFQGLHGHDHLRPRLGGRTRQSMRTFFEPRPTSQGHSNHVAMTHRTHITLHIGRHQNTTQKAKRKALTWNFLFNISCRYTTPVQSSFATSLHPSKAHRICSVKMDLGKDFWKYFTAILILSFLFTLAFYCGPELACSGGMGG